MKDRLNLYVDEELIQRVKIQAVLNKTSVSEFVEKLLLAHLERVERRKEKKSK
jgi:hypothetical protein